MIRFLLAILVTLFTVYDLAFAGQYDLAGTWMRAGGTADEKPVLFVPVNGQYHYYSQERFVFPYGRLSHTIDQAVTLPVSGTEILRGTVDFYDSRGCSFKAYEVVAQFQGPHVVNILMTVPRYKYVTITTNTSVRHECRLLEKVQVPVQLYR